MKDISELSVEVQTVGTFFNPFVNFRVGTTQANPALNIQEEKGIDVGDYVYLFFLGLEIVNLNEPDEYGRTQRSFIKGALLNKQFVDEAYMKAVELKRIVSDLQLVSIRPNATLATQITNGSMTEGCVYKVSKKHGYGTQYFDKATNKTRICRTEGIFAELLVFGDEEKTQTVFGHIGQMVLNKIKQQKELWDQQQQSFKQNFKPIFYLDQIKTVLGQNLALDYPVSEVEVLELPHEEQRENQRSS